MWTHQNFPHTFTKLVKLQTIEKKTSPRGIIPKLNSVYHRGVSNMTNQVNTGQRTIQVDVSGILVELNLARTCSKFLGCIFNPCQSFNSILLSNKLSPLLNKMANYLSVVVLCQRFPLRFSSSARQFLNSPSINSRNLNRHFSVLQPVFRHNYRHEWCTPRRMFGH